MVLALPTKPKLVDLNGKRLKRSAAPIAMIGAAAVIAKRKERRQDNKLAARAKLMLAAKMEIYVTEAVPVGRFVVIDPETMEPGERLTCDFQAKTLVVHPDDIGRATEHFEAEAKEPARGARC